MASAYFEAQLPVTERVVRLLAGKFGFVLQKYGRKCRQCGEVPSLAVARDAPAPAPALGLYDFPDPVRPIKNV